MSLTSGALGWGRELAAKRNNTETFTAYTVASAPGADGINVDTETVLYSGVAGRVKFPSDTVSEVNQGSQVPAVQRLEVHVAVGATPNVVVNTMWRVTASTADASFVGRTYRTKGEADSGQVTAHRYPVERVV